MGGPERPVSGLSIKDGAEVECGARRFVIMQLIGFDFVVARDIETDELVRLAVVDLNPVSPAPSTVPSLSDLSKVDDRDWAEARRRLDLIAPLLDGTRSPRAVIVERAQAAGLDASTLYRWAQAYRASGLLSSLLPYKPCGGRGKSRLDAGVEEIVKATIGEHFLTRQQRTVQRSGRRRWKWRAAAAKRSCLRLMQTRFGSESRRFQRGNAWVADLIARSRSISLRRGPVCSTAHNDRWTSCKSITRNSISSWSTLSRGSQENSDRRAR
jgi:transposase